MKPNEMSLRLHSLDQRGIFPGKLCHHEKCGWDMVACQQVQQNRGIFRMWSVIKRKIQCPFPPAVSPPHPVPRLLPGGGEKGITPDGQSPHQKKRNQHTARLVSAKRSKGVIWSRLRSATAIRCFISSNASGSRRRESTSEASFPLSQRTFPNPCCSI